MNAPNRENAFRFGQYEVDLPAAELRKNGRKISIQDKPLRLLEYLARRPGEVVTRAEIQRHLWPEDTTIDFEDGLNTAVKKLREALNDSSEKPRYIETVPRRGYRFVAVVEILPDTRQSGLARGKADGTGSEAANRHGNGDAGSPDGEVAPAAVRDSAKISSANSGGDAELSMAHLRTAGAGAPIPGLPERFAATKVRWTWLAIAVAVVAVAASGWFLRVRRRMQNEPAEASIVVLPFANLTGDSHRDYLSDGVTEEVIMRLAAMNADDMRVIARTSAMAYRGTAMTARQIGDQLGVGYLMEGSLQQDGEQVRVIAQLVRVSDQTHLWAKSYEGGVGQLQEFENDIANSAAQSLLGEHAKGLASDQTIVGTQAYDLYLQGLSALSQRSLAGFELALEDFSKSVQLEPKFARAYAELADTYNLMGQYNWMRQDEARTQGRAAALQALAIDPSLAEARAALGFSYWFYDWDNKSAERELSSAVAREPSNVDAQHWLSMVMLTSGRFREAEEHLGAALSLDPNSLILQTNLGWIHYTEGNFAIAVREMRKVEEQHPDFLSARLKLWYAYSLMHDEPKAWEEYRYIVRAITTPQLDAKVEHAFKVSGYTAALKTLASGDDDMSYANYADRARLLDFAGDKNGAILELQRGVKEHDGWMIFVPTDPAFRSMRGDERFQAIARQIERIEQAPDLARN
jgi:TolB-like protein/DNA-binding winged helix-turn-helix (wHTH) protein